MTKSEIFKKAHQIAKSTVAVVGNYSIALSLALKEVYASLSQETVSVESKLIDLGCKVWEMGSMKRIYINEDKMPEVFGFEIGRYSSSLNICWAFLNNEKISNSKARDIMFDKHYYCLVENKWFSSLTPII